MTLFVGFSWFRSRRRRSMDAEEVRRFFKNEALSESSSASKSLIFGF